LIRLNILPPFGKSTLYKSLDEYKLITVWLTGWINAGNKWWRSNTV